MAKVAWRYATAADLPLFFDEPVPHTMRAVVVTIDGEPAGLTGLAAGGPVACFFSEERPLFGEHRHRMATRRAVHEALARVMQWVRASPLKVFSISDNKPLLERLGFVHLEQDLYVWPS